MDEQQGPRGPKEEIRFAVVLNGGVSLAVWMGGVVLEIDQVTRGWGPTACFSTCSTPGLAPTSSRAPRRAGSTVPRSPSARRTNPPTSG